EADNFQVLIWIKKGPLRCGPMAARARERVNTKGREAPMTATRNTLVAIAFGLALSASPTAIARAQGVIGNLANNASILIDGRTFSVTAGAPKADGSADLAKIGPRELGPGAIIFRSCYKLYIAHGFPPFPTTLADTDVERQRALGLRDTDIERQRALGYRELTDAEMRRQKGLRDTDIERQRALGYRELTDAEMRRQKGLRDTDIER